MNTEGGEVLGQQHTTPEQSNVPNETSSSEQGVGDATSQQTTTEQPAADPHQQADAEWARLKGLTDAEWVQEINQAPASEHAHLHDLRASLRKSERWEDQVGQHIPPAMREAHRGDFWRAMADQFHPDYPRERSLRNAWIREPIAGRVDRMQFRVREVATNFRNSASNLRAVIGR